jgi:hypothetical protein
MWRTGLPASGQGRTMPRFEIRRFDALLMVPRKPHDHPADL